MSAPDASFYMPDNPQLLVVLARMAIVHEHLTFVLKMTIKTLCGLTPLEARTAMNRDTASYLRNMILKISRQKLSNNYEALLKIKAFVNRAHELSSKRNELTHGLWVKVLDGEAGIIEVSGELRPLPSVEQIEKLSMKMNELTVEWNLARLEGFIKTALEEQASSCS